MSILVKKIILSLISAVVLIALGVVIFVAVQNDRLPRGEQEEQDTNEDENADEPSDNTEENGTSDDEQGDEVDGGDDREGGGIDEEALNEVFDIEGDEKNEEEDGDGNENEANDPAVGCVETDFAGFWTLTTDLQGQSFTPPYADEQQKFEFKIDGTVNFTEHYEDGAGGWADSHHTGKWSVDAYCNFVYEGKATGRGVDGYHDNASYTLQFTITARGKVETKNRVTGTWRSSEIYTYDTGDIVTNLVTGTFVATR